MVSSFVPIVVAGCLIWPVQPRPNAQTESSPKTVSELLGCLDHAAAGLQDYTVSGVTDSHGKKQRFKLTYKRPNLVRIDTGSGQVAVQPNGDIRGRLGHGVFGHISQRLKRSDKRLRDDEGIPFYESDFVSLIARIQAQIKSGAVATMNTEASAYVLDVYAGDSGWRYRFDKTSFFILDNSRSVKGQTIETTQFTDFKPNTGVKEDVFRF